MASIQLRWLTLLLVTLLGVTVVLTSGAASSVDLSSRYHAIRSSSYMDAELVDEATFAELHADMDLSVEGGDDADAGADEPAGTDSGAEPNKPVNSDKTPWVAPTLPPLKVGLTEDVAPAIHPASGVEAGGVGPTAEELDAILGPLSPPDGCGHMITAWKNYIWKFRTVPGSGVTGKDQYTQEVTEQRFANFCANLKQHQLQSAERKRLTTTPPNVEKLQWNKYYDLKSLKHLRGFHYTGMFGKNSAVLTPEAPGTSASPAVSAPVALALSLIESSSEISETLLPAIPEPTTFATKPIARDPLVPDFDFTLNTKIVKAPLDQNNCGADYAFATVALLEATFAIQCQPAPYSQSLEELHFGSVSSQQLISCANHEGCRGGDVIDGLNFALRNPLRTREGYPLEPGTFLTDVEEIQIPPTCKVDPAVEASAAKPMISSYGNPIHTCRQRHDDFSSICLEQDEEELARFVAKQPVTAVIDANDATFSALYSGYIIEAKDCSSLPSRGDHVVLIVGLLTDSATGKKVWKIQNSYGQDWGHNGYAYLEYGYNTCGIANYNHFVQTTCERPVGPDPIPRPPTPTTAPVTVAMRSLAVPKRPDIRPTVPVDPNEAAPLPSSSSTGPAAPAQPWWASTGAAAGVTGVVSAPATASTGAAAATGAAATSTGVVAPATPAPSVVTVSSGPTTIVITTTTTTTPTTPSTVPTPTTPTTITPTTPAVTTPTTPTTIPTTPTTPTTPSTITPTIPPTIPTITTPTTPTTPTVKTA